MSPEGPPTEQQFKEELALLESARAQLEGLGKQQELIQLAVEEHVRARETIKEMAKGAPGDDVLVPIGADSYVHAKISDNRDTIVGVGSKVSLRKSPAEAEKLLDERIDDLSRAFKSITDKAAQTEAMMQELQEKIQAQYEQLQSLGKG